MKKKLSILVILTAFVFIFLFVFSCFKPETDEDKVKSLYKKLSKSARKKEWGNLFPLLSKESAIRSEMILKTLFEVLEQTPKFTTDEIQKQRIQTILTAKSGFEKMSGKEYFFKAFQAVGQYPEYLNNFLGNLKIYTDYDVMDVKILKERAYILIKTPQNLKEAIFFIKENQEWKFLILNELDQAA